jgi:hypothetical protein
MYLSTKTVKRADGVEIKAPAFIELDIRRM